MSTLTWVAGGGGLLGSQVRAALELSPELAPWQPPFARLSWADAPTVAEQLGVIARALTRDATSGPRRGWAVVWCAGAGIVGSSDQALAAETATWERFLEALRIALADTPTGVAGRIVFTSSAGGVYGMGTPPFSEESPCSPASEYGRAKLRQEQALAVWARRLPNVSTLVVRISNLYGPGQRLDKPQGLISHMARSVIHGRPIHIYVSLDTVRDYLFAEDAGAAMARWTARLGEEAERAGTACHVVKLCASERDTTVSDLIGFFRRIARRRVRVVSGLHPSQALQPAQLRFRSRVWREPPAYRTGLLEGISRVYREQLALYQAGSLAPPSAHPPFDQTPSTEPIA